MGKFVSVAVIAAIIFTVGLLLLVAVMAGAGAGSSGSGPTNAAGPSTGQVPGSGGVQPGPAIPPTWLTLYQQAANICTGLPWPVLAAIGTVETRSGQSTAPGVWSGANGAGAEGPMQFEPATFAAYATVDTAAAVLCGNGAGAPATLRTAVADYNHSESYVNTVLTLAIAFGQDPSASGTVVVALSYAAQQLNTPYVWGGAGTGGFDCSGLAQAAYRNAGIALPRVAQDQFDIGPRVPAGSTVQPGDLIFFGSGPTGVDHVGLYVGAGEMIDTPSPKGYRRLELPFSFEVAA